MAACAVALAVLLAGCGEDEPETVTVRAEQLDESWPLTADAAIIRCEDDAVIAEINGEDYGLNGTATSRGFPRLGRLWRPDPNVEGLNVSITPLLETGLSLCD